MTYPTTQITFTSLDDLVLIAADLKAQGWKLLDEYEVDDTISTKAVFCFAKPHPKRPKYWLQLFVPVDVDFKELYMGIFVGISPYRQEPVWEHLIPKEGGRPATSDLWEYFRIADLADYLDIELAAA